MNIRRRRGALLVASTLLLAGCASSRADSTDATPSTRPGASMTPGMVMPGGSTMGATAAPSAAGKPSKAASMICSNEVRSDIATILKLPTKPVPTSRWSHQVLTCTYRLPMGTVVLSVKESGNDASARTYAAGLRKKLGGTEKLFGLTDIAFGTPGGIVALVKDNDTLQVDASRLPAQFGSQQQKRSAFAYELASDILGCWTGDDGN